LIWARLHKDFGTERWKRLEHLIVPVSVCERAFLFIHLFSPVFLYFPLFFFSFHHTGMKEPMTKYGEIDNRSPRGWKIGNGTKAGTPEINRIISVGHSGQLF